MAGRPYEEAEALLRAYLGGANERRQRLDLTTPLWRDSEGAVFLALPGIQVIACLGGYSCMCRTKMTVVVQCGLVSIRSTQDEYCQYSLIAFLRGGEPFSSLPCSVVQ